MLGCLFHLQRPGNVAGVCGRSWRTRADPLVEVWDSVLVPMLEKAPQLEPQTLLLHLEQIRPGEEWFRRKRTLQRRVEQWQALHSPGQEVMFMQEHRAGVLSISDFTCSRANPSPLPGWCLSTGCSISACPIRVDVMWR